MCSIRVSIENQVLEGFSLPEQEKRLHAMCEYKGYEIYKIYKDAGISAKTGNHRPAFEELKEDIKKKKVNMIVVLKLDSNSNEVKEIVDNLKTILTSKDKYVLKQDDKDKIDKFIQQVNTTNKEYKKMQKLSITLNDVETELQENKEMVKILTENNNVLNIKVKSLEKKIDKQEDEIDDLKEKNSKLT